VTIHDVAADGQTKAETAPVFFGRKKGFKHICQNFRGHADAVVPDFNLDIAGTRQPVRVQGKVSTIWKRVNGVHDKGQDNLFDLARIAADVWKIRSEIEVEFDVLQLQLVLDEPDAAINNSI
jgi:hypothetical protein